MLRHFARCVTFLSLGVLLAPASAQDLLSTLKSQSVQELAKAARQKGNPINGSILFTNRKLACTQCHAGDDQQRLGPDLASLSSETSDQHLVESLIYPSKAIRKEFKTTKFLLDDGRTLVGRIVDSSQDRYLVRTADDKRDLMTLKKSEIEQMAANEISAMPEDLVNELPSQQSFLDLARYLMQLVASQENARTQTRTPIPDRILGMAALGENGCLACHDTDSSITSIVHKQGPNLRWIGSHLSPRYIRDFIHSPSRTKPGTSMPDMLAKLASADRELAAKELTHFLVSLDGNRFQKEDVDPISAERGQQLFHQTGCVACHSPRDKSGTATLANSSVQLHELQQKYDLSGLVEFLEDPLAVRSSGRMPNMKLSHWEAVDVANYLLSERKPKASRITENDFELDAELAKRGARRFAELGCQACHSRISSEPLPFSAKPLAQLQSSQGCLTDNVGNHAHYQLSAHDRTLLMQGIQSAREAWEEEDKLLVSLSSLRCLSCHQRDVFGGVTPDRNPHFQTLDPNLGPQGRIPPPLTGIGAKIKPLWMRQVLVSGKSIRPYVVTRMPQYGTNNVQHLVDLFQSLDATEPMRFPQFKDIKETRKIGAELVGTGGLNCIVCHTFQLKKSANMSAVDLTDMSERLKQGWFHRYMLKPQQFSRNTIMPSFWPSGVAMRKDILDGESDRQIEAIWQYLLDGRQARTPRGLIREPIELLATDEAVMLRRKFPGIGKRGIGVGYPAQINLAFDAEQIRLAMIWKGKFVDPGGVWRSQGHGNVRTLGERPIAFSTGPDLDRIQNPWVVDESRPPDHQFRGYSLDKLRRPAFKYTVNEIHVSDYVTDQPESKTDGPQFARLIELSSENAQMNYRFRLASGEKIASQDGVYTVDNVLTIQILSDSRVEVVEHAGQQQLWVKLPKIHGSEKIKAIYRW